MTSFKKTRSFLASAFLGAATALSGACASLSETPAPAPAPVPAPVPAPEQAPKASLREQAPELLGILDMISRVHVDEANATDGRKAMIDAINGVLEGLDPHSHYFTAEEYKAFNEGQSGEFGGLGVELNREGKLLKVVAPIEGSPAERAGIQSGDIITHIDGQSVYAIGIENTSKKLRGAPGTTVDLKIMRKGVEKPLDITVTREIIKTPVVKFAKIGSDVGYVKLAHFSYVKTRADGTPLRDWTGRMAEDGASLVRDAILAMKKEMGPSAAGYILDLRNDPGGMTTQAVDVADHFLDAGKTVYTMRGRVAGANGTYKTRIPGDITDGKPLIVLVNEGSASASELVAGALQDHNRAVVMGTRTFGKGTVQQLRPMDNGEALKITIAQYYTPLDRSVQGKGITPDIEFKALAKDELAEMRLREADMPHSLGNTKGNAEDNRTRATCSPANENTPVAGLPKILIDRAGKADDMALCAIETLRGRQDLTRTVPVAPKGP